MEIISWKIKTEITRRIRAFVFGLSFGYDSLSDELENALPIKSAFAKDKSTQISFRQEKLPLSTFY